MTKIILPADLDAATIYVYHDPRQKTVRVWHGSLKSYRLNNPTDGSRLVRRLTGPPFAVGLLQGILKIYATKDDPGSFSEQSLPLFEQVPDAQDFHDWLARIDTHELFPLFLMTGKQVREAEETMLAAADVYLRHAREIKLFAELSRVVQADGDAR